MLQFLRLVATFFYVGYVKKAPGTVATVATIPLAWALLMWGPIYAMIVSVMLVPLAIVASQVYETHFSQNEHDASEIVIDEVVGFLITMAWMPLTWQAFAVGFVLFRILDIWKPFPIGYLDRKIPGGAGVVLDDVAAGLIANIIMQVLLSKTSILGTQIIQSGGCYFLCG